MAAPTVRGDKSHIRILRNGVQVDWQEILSFDDAAESQHHKSHYVGKERPETDVFEMGYGGTINGEIRNDVVDQLMQEIRTARKSGVATPVVNIMVYQRYPDGALDGSAGKTVLFTDVQFTEGGHIGGAPEKTTKSLTFTAADKILL